MVELSRLLRALPGWEASSVKPRRFLATLPVEVQRGAEEDAHEFLRYLVDVAQHRVFREHQVP